MFGDVWEWAGTFRNSNKNIGVDKYQIGVDLRMLLDNCRFWIEEKIYNEDGIAIRFKHRIVSIHCFANGNDRHSRLIGDIIIERLFGKKIFNWNAQDLAQTGEIRSNYLKALREADKGNYEPLIQFTRS